VSGVETTSAATVLDRVKFSLTWDINDYIYFIQTLTASRDPGSSCGFTRDLHVQHVQGIAIQRGGVHMAISSLSFGLNTYLQPHHAHL
jgi:hypothetical protein